MMMPKTQGQMSQGGAEVEQIRKASFTLSRLATFARPFGTQKERWVTLDALNADWWDPHGKPSQAISRKIAQ